MQLFSPLSRRTHMRRRTIGMERSSSYTFLSILPLLAILSGCLSPRPPMETIVEEVTPIRSAETVRADAVDIQTLPITSSILDMIDDDRLRELVLEAQRNNPELLSTAERIRAFRRSLMGDVNARLLPAVEAGLSRSRNNQAIDLITGSRTTETLYNARVSAEWEIDIWGRLIDERVAGRAQIESQRLEQLYARDVLAVHVLQSWIDQAAIRRAIVIQEERVHVLSQIEQIVTSRFADGIGSLDELSTARSRIALARSELNALHATWHGSIRNLEVLLGRYPRGELIADSTLPEIEYPPLDPPTSALLNRPDIQAAISQLDATRRLSRSARKAILPSLHLSGEVFRETADFEDLVDATHRYAVAGSVVVPLFAGGSIPAAVRAREAEEEAAVHTLNQTILRAAAEVEIALENEHYLRLQRETLEAALTEAVESSRLHEERYRQGLVTIQSLLFAREQEMDLKIEINEVQAQRLINRLTLALALGFGLENDSEEATNNENR